MIYIVIAIFVIAILMYGFHLGVAYARTDAFAHGVGEWGPDGNGRPQWNWKRK